MTKNYDLIKKDNSDLIKIMLATTLLNPFIYIIFFLPNSNIDISILTAGLVQVIEWVVGMFLLSYLNYGNLSFDHT